MYSTSDFKKGLKIEYNGKPYVIIDFQHVSPGKGAAFSKVRLKNLETQQTLDVTFKSNDMVDEADITLNNMQFLYKEGESFIFMDNSTYEQVSLSAAEVNEAAKYLKENDSAQIMFYNGRPITVEVENFVILRIVETQPNIKGDTSGGGGKPAKLETGLTVTVPFHLNEGELIKIDTRTDMYLERIRE